MRDVSPRLTIQGPPLRPQWHIQRWAGDSDKAIQSLPWHLDHGHCKREGLLPFGLLKETGFGTVSGHLFSLPSGEYSFENNTNAKRKAKLRDKETELYHFLSFWIRLCLKSHFFSLCFTKKKISFLLSRAEFLLLVTKRDLIMIV